MPQLYFSDVERKAAASAATARYMERHRDRVLAKRAARRAALAALCPPKRRLSKEEAKAAQKINYARYMELHGDRDREARRVRSRQIVPGFGIAYGTKRARDERASNPTGVLFRATRWRAKRLGVPFDLTLKDIVIPEFCPVLGIPIVPKTGSGKSGPTDNSPSIDRVVPRLGYVRGNVNIISNRANKIKNDASPEEIFLVHQYAARGTAIIKWRSAA